MNNHEEVVPGRLYRSKVLHVCGRWECGGIRTVVQGLLDLNVNHTATRHDLMLTLDASAPEAPHYRALALGFRWSRFFESYRTACKWVAGYDTIFIHGAHPVAVLAIWRCTRPSFVFQHGMAVSSGSYVRRSLKKIWFSLIPFLLNARVVCGSRFARKKMKRLGIRLRERQIAIVPFGIRLPTERTSNARDESGQDLTIGLAGRLVEQKRFRLILQSMKVPDLRLRVKIAGEGPQKEELMGVARELESKGVHTEFLGQVDDMDGFYRSLDLLVCPGEGESFGLVPFEALARGVPVALFPDVGAPLEFLENENCHFVLKKEEEWLRRFWQEVSRNPQLLARKRLQILQADWSHLDIGRTRRQLEEVAATMSRDLAGSVAPWAAG